MSAQVLHEERADGALEPLRQLLQLWKIHGTHDVEIPEEGGYRFGPIDEARQEELFRTKQSHARTLQETPHGRRSAIDMRPVGFNPHRGFDHASNFGMLEKFLAQVAFIDKYGPALGIRSGAHFKNMGPLGDLPHFELCDWVSRRFPSGDLVVVLVPPAPGAPHA